MYTIHQQAIRVEYVTVEIMGRAVQSAVQLGNYPLSPVDVQCAFESTISAHSDIDATMESLIRFNLERLGYKF